MKRTMLLIAAPGQQPCSNAGLDVQTTESLGDATVLQLSNDADPRSSQLAGVERVELHFPQAHGLCGRHPGHRRCAG
jgi:hypothetical protein